MKNKAEGRKLKVESWFGRWSGITACTLLSLTLALADGAADFDAANKLYEQGRYREAVTAYEQLARTNPTTPALLFNLGNAHFKSGQNGRAIATYLQAQRLAPRDPDIQANLQFARAQVTGPTLRPGWLERQAAALTLNEWTLLATGPLWLLLVLLTAGQLKPELKSKLRTTTFVAALLTLLGGSALVFALMQRTGEKILVVTARETVVRHGPLEESQSAFTVNDGAELRWLDRKDDWIQVTDGTRPPGWLKSSAALELP